MKPRVLTLLAMMGALIAFPAFALELHQARTSGMVGEKTDGYTAALKTSVEVSTLVADVNAKRKEEYARISKQNGQPVDVVAKLAAALIINGLEAGSSYQDASGNWKIR